MCVVDPNSMLSVFVSCAASVRTLVYPGGKLRPTQLLRNVRRRFKLINGVLIPGGGQVLSPGHPFYDASDHLLSLALDANDQGDYFPVSHFNSISTPGSCRVLARVALLIVIDPLCWIPACLVAFLVTQGVFDPEWKQTCKQNALVACRCMGRAWASRRSRSWCLTTPPSSASECLYATVTLPSYSVFRLT